MVTPRDRTSDLARDRAKRHATAVAMLRSMLDECGYDDGFAQPGPKPGRQYDPKFVYCVRPDGGMRKWYAATVRGLHARGWIERDKGEPLRWRVTEAGWDALAT